MYGKEYLEWQETERVNEKFGAFMESLDADERVLLEGVLRKRYREFVQPSAFEGLLRNKAQCKYPSQTLNAAQAQANRAAGCVTSIFGL